MDDAALGRLWLALTDQRRRLIGRLRPRMVGWPHPRRRLQQLRGPLLRGRYGPSLTAPTDGSDTT